VTLLVANQLAADLCTEELEQHMAFVAAALRARHTFRDLDEVEPRRSPLPPAADTDPAPPCDEDDGG
jgi:hypothetical protein